MASIDKTSHCRGGPITSKQVDDDIIRRLTIASFLCLAFLFVEIVGGYLSSSLAILSDAAHLFSDLASFIIAIIASKLARLPPDSKNTYGFRRAEALAALFSMCCLCVVSCFLFVEAIERGVLFWGVQQAQRRGEVDGDAVQVDGRIMTYTAAVGVVVNVCLAVVLGEHHHHGPMGGGHDHSHGHGHGHEEEDGHGCDSHGHGHGHKGGHDHGNGDAVERAEDDGHHSHEHHDHSPAISNGGHSHDHHHESKTEEDSPLLDSEKHETNYSGTDNEYTTESQNKERNVNLQAAYLHVLGDLLQSAAVLLSGLVIWYNPRWQLFDPVITMLFCVIVVKTTVGVIVSSISVLMNDVPSDIDWSEVYDGISSAKGILRVEDLHIWSISHSIVALSAHVNYDESITIDEALERVQTVCRKSGIHHTTIQLRAKVIEDVDNGSEIV